MLRKSYFGWGVVTTIFGVVLWSWTPPDDWRISLTRFLCVCMVFACAMTMNAYCHEWREKRKPVSKQIKFAEVTRLESDFSLLGRNSKVVECSQCNALFQAYQGVSFSLWPAHKKVTCPECGKTQAFHD